MTPDVVMYAAGAVATLLGGWQTRQSRQIKTMREHQTAQDEQLEAQRRQIKALRGQVGNLSTWQSTAREYIGQLLYVMAVHGVKPPRPPDALGLTIPNQRPDQEA
jgi:hypothetical protein